MGLFFREVGRYRKREKGGRWKERGREGRREGRTRTDGGREAVNYPSN
jgi:hypothetical protein